MASPDPLQLFAFDDLLVLWWPKAALVQGDLSVVLNREPVAKPLLGVRLPDQGGYLFAARVPRLPALKRLRAEVIGPDALVLACGRAVKTAAFSPEQWAHWSLPIRIRIEKALIGHLPKVFPELPPATLSAVAAALAETRAEVFRFADGSLYFRLPWQPLEEAVCMDVTVKSLFSSRAEDFAEPVKALLEGGWLHGFLRRAPVDSGVRSPWIVDAGKARTAPIALERIVDLPAGRSADAAIDAICADYPGDKSILRAFAEAVRKPPRRRAGELNDPERLAGGIDALADGRIKGWAFDRQRPHASVALHVMIGERLLGVADANLPRPEQAAAGYGHCGFVLSLDEEWLSGEHHELHFHCAETGLELPGSPLLIGRGRFDARMHLDDEGCFAGWVRERCGNAASPRLRVFLDDVAIGEIDTHAPRASDHCRDGRRAFRFPLPDAAFDEQVHRVEAEILAADGRVFHIADSVRFRAAYRGHIETAGPGGVTGWIVNTIAPKRPVALDVMVNGKKLASVRANQPRPNGADNPAESRCGFGCALPSLGLEVGSLALEFRVAGTATQVLGPVLLHTPYDVAVRSIATLAEMLNDPQVLTRLSGGLVFDEDVSTWVRTQVVAKVLGELRRAKSIPAKLEFQVAPLIGLPAAKPADATVDVIVPIYMGRDETLHCLASLMAARCRTPMEVIAINDASPDPEFNRELRAFAAARGFSLLENPRNLGFVGTVNRGMRLHEDRDVVLLNSDTVVADGWLDRLHGAVQSARNIGTATPMSNNATICSFPVFCAENPIPEGSSVAELDALFAEANAGQIVDVPTAVGFCMYIKRAALNEVGYFDEEKWGKGYGEENDFCLRATSLGWRHVAACDVFVEHAGGISFAEGKSQRLEKNLAKLNELYPDYSATVQRFIAQDSLAGARNAVAKRLLQRRMEPRVLFVLHGLGGGTQVAADDLAVRLAAEGQSVLVLTARTPDLWELREYGASYTLQYRYPRDFNVLKEDLRELRVWHVHYHQTLGFSRRILELARELGVRYDFSLHDYLSLCPRVNMIDESGYYCGSSQFDAATCDRCIRINGLEHGLEAMYREFGGSVGQWRSVHGDFLKRARRVFTPSQDAAERVRRHFPLLNVRVRPHPEARSEIRLRSTSAAPYTVAVLGAIGPHKGYDILKRCIRSAEKEGLPLRFVVIGFTCDDTGLQASGNVEITGKYAPSDLPGLIESSGAAVALFLSPWPETYCYALSEAWRHGLYPVSLDLGAVAERIRQQQCGRLIPTDADPKFINRTLMEVFETAMAEPGQAVTGEEPARILKNYYELSPPKVAAGCKPRPGSAVTADGARESRA